MLAVLGHIKSRVLLTALIGENDVHFCQTLGGGRLDGKNLPGHTGVVPEGLLQKAIHRLLRRKAGGSLGRGRRSRSSDGILALLLLLGESRNNQNQRQKESGNGAVHAFLSEQGVMFC